MKKVMAFVKKHPTYNGTIHALGGLGVGLLIAHYFPGTNLILWGVILVIAAGLGHVYMLIA